MAALRLLLLVLCAAGAFAQAIEVGAGAPTEAIRQAFISAYFRNGFNFLLNSGAPATGNVKKLGSTGLVQEFQDPAKTSGVRYALVKANASVTPPMNGAYDVFQVYPGLYAYYTTLASATVGYPNADTGACPPVVNNSCTYLTLDKNYALFSYATSLFSGQNFSTRDPFYTRWVAAGGIAGLGPANNPEQTYTSALSSVTATFQTFDQGAIYSITSGSLTGRVFAVRQPVYALYARNGAHAGVLGLPTGDDVLLPIGLRSQSFEGGTIVYDPFTATPILQVSVASVQITGAGGTVRLNQGDSIQLQATAYSGDSLPLTGRSFTWTTSDSRVASVEANGASATIRAVGGGSARIQASSEGKSSAAVILFVTAPCCAVGEGAPTAAVGQMFADALARNHLAPKLPAAAPVTRLAAGYVQWFQSADGAANFLVAAPDQYSAAYVVEGALLARYQQLGGPAGSLGYPQSDATAGGRQLFVNGALAGSPVAVVSGAFLAKWAALGYETGAAGDPLGDPVSFLTFTGTGGHSQSFTKGLIESATTAPYAGKTWFLSGPILAKFVQLGGIGGQLGMPLTDEYILSGRHRQDFEGGSVSYLGTEEPQVAARDRQPAVYVTPATVVAGNRVRVAAGGFANGATLKISLSGQADFTVATDTGAYAWEFPVAAKAKSSSITVTAIDTASRATAKGSFQVLSVEDASLHITKVSGDAQAGVSGARLPLPVRIRITDDGGNPVAGIPVNFAGSPGVQVESPDAVTDPAGEAAAWLRMPRAVGIALANAEAAHQFVTFSAQSAAGAVAQFQGLSQAVSGIMGSSGAAIATHGSLLASVASVLRYHQLRGELPVPQGLADVPALNAYLGSICIPDARAGQICDGYLLAGEGSDPVVNLWRVPSFVGGNLDVFIYDAAEATIRDLVAAGSPVLVALDLYRNGVASGAHFVVATGVAADGSILIFDPDPAQGRSRLADYTAAGQAVRGDLAGVVRLVPGAAVPAAFLVMTPSEASLTAGASPCGHSLRLLDRAVPLWLRACAAADSVYQLDLPAEGEFHGLFTDLGAPGLQLELSGYGPASYKVQREGGNWTVSTLAAAIADGGVRNSASLTERVARGGLISIFGSGLSAAGMTTRVTIGGEPAQVTLAAPFRLNAVVPQELAPGRYTLRVDSPFGIAEQDLQIEEFAPALLSGAATDENGSLVTAANPVVRGRSLILYATGLGRLTGTAAGPVLTAPVTAVVRGQEVSASLIGIAAGLPGIYQIRVTIPAALAPGTSVTVGLRQAGQDSNTVEIAVQ